MTSEIDESRRAVEFLSGVTAGTVELNAYPKPKDGFLISVPYYSLAGRGTWDPDEIKSWWDGVHELCTTPKPWFKKVSMLNAIGGNLDLLSTKSVLYAGTWLDGDTRWFDANLHIPRDLDPDGSIDLATLHPATPGSPASWWHLRRRTTRDPDALDVAFSVGRILHQAAVWELDILLPEGGRSWPVWY